VSHRRELIQVALGRAPADAVIVGGTLVDVITGELRPAEIAIKGDRIAAVAASVAHTRGLDTETIHADGRWLAPGLIDGHLHQYHSYLGIDQFAEALLRHGVTCTADGFYGPGIVAGPEAVRFFKEAFERTPVRLIFLVPVIAWLQNRELGLTPAPGITMDDMNEMLDWAGCIGLEEPPYLPVVDHDEDLLDLFDATLERRKVVTGHAAGIEARELQAYAAVGVSTDHESTEAHDALMKARAGMRLLMRQGSGCGDVPEVVRAHTELGADARGFGFCADVASAEKLMDEGTIDHAVRVAISGGVPPVTALQMATLNTARAFRVQHDMGCLAPGRYADVLFVDDLRELSIESVMVGGRTVVRGGELVVDLPPTEYPRSFRDTVHVAGVPRGADLTLRAPEGLSRVDVRVIGVTEGSLVSEERQASLPAVDGRVAADPAQDVAHLAMIDRLGKDTGIGLGFVQGFGLQRGAFASTANSVCENLVIVGADPHDMAVAANHLVSMGGGKAVVADGEVVASVPMPVLGLHADEPLSLVMEKFAAAVQAIRDLGCDLANPFSQLEFCFACGEIGDLKLSEEGLIRIRSREVVDPLVA
jgi:adenine deaminase